LINFYQDIAQDIDKNDRLYLPLDDMNNHNVSIMDIKQHKNTPQTQTLLKQQLQRSRQLYQSGSPLCAQLTGRFALEIRMIYSSGNVLFDKLEHQTHSIYLRPRLTYQDKFKIIWQGFYYSL
jgi:phytoene/squalene synthetase